MNTLFLGTLIMVGEITPLKISIEKLVIKSHLQIFEAKGIKILLAQIFR
jgi:hypothetical protein